MGKGYKRYEKNNYKAYTEMIYGIGTDIVEVKRIRELLNKYGIALANKILTSQELLTYKKIKGKELDKYSAETSNQFFLDSRGINFN